MDLAPRTRVKGGHDKHLQKVKVWRPGPEGGQDGGPRNGPEGRPLRDPDLLAEDYAIFQAQLKAGANAHACHLLYPVAKIFFRLVVILGGDLKYKGTTLARFTQAPKLLASDRLCSNYPEGPGWPPST